MPNVNGYETKAALKRHFKDKGHKFTALLARPESNPKLAKNGKVGVKTSPMHLAPASLSGFNVCPQASQGCIKACLHTAGNPAYMAQKHLSRIARTKAYFGSRPEFMALLYLEIAALERAAKRDKMACGVRLNATSDIAWERIRLTVDGVEYPNLMSLFPDIEFYDYTKVTKRAIRATHGKKWPSNYHLTFSKTDGNDSDVEKVLQAGGNVAVVYNNEISKKFEKMRAQNLTPFHGLTPVINGDEHDFRPLDPQGVIVGLKAKGDARHDDSGFVVQSL